MNKIAKTKDGTKISYEITGTSPTALLFVHGWLGNAQWWKNQIDYFRETFTIIRIDLPGHGKSSNENIVFSSKNYALAIKAVIDDVNLPKIILVGHSMSGAYSLKASLITAKIKAVILVDTLKNMNQLMSYAQAEELLFANYRADFDSAVMKMLPKFLFSKKTPKLIQEQLQIEFLNYPPEFAVKSIEPLYRMDIRTTAKQVKVPVRALNSDVTPTNLKSNLHYFIDYKYANLAGTGHYPMLEKPEEFNSKLLKILKSLQI